jgi:signal peptidase I
MGLVAMLAHRSGLYLGAGLFLLFGALARYWRYRLPGGRYASPLPWQLVAGETDGDRLARWADHAALYERLRSPGMRRGLERTLDREKLAEFDGRLAEFRAGLEAGDDARVVEARKGVEASAARALERRRARDALALLGMLGAAVGMALALRAYVAQSYRVLSASMLPTLETDDLVLGRRRPYATDVTGAHRGDVIVFRGAAIPVSPGRPLPEILVKRVIGLPGDRVAMVGGVPIINGWQIPSCDAGDYVYALAEGDGRALHGRLHVEFLDDRAYLTVLAMGGPPFPDAYLVKPGEVFVLGDNRSNSLDSRAYAGGRGAGVPGSGIDARVQWFLVGTHRSGDTDLGRWMRPVDALEERVHLEGVQTEALEAGVARCLANRPADSRPPAPSL